MKIPFLDLQRQYLSIKPEIDGAIQEVVARQYFILSKDLEKFEKDYASYLDVKYVVGVGSGTEGLILALRALGVSKGDEVITPVNSFIATALAITELGATPIFVDCDPATYELNIDQVEEKLTKKTKVILPVHLYGAPCSGERLKKIADRENIFLVEDACQAHGSTYAGKKVGTFGDLGVFSFYPGKNLGAYGDGGAICTDDEMLYNKLLKLRNYGQSKKYYHDTIGVNSRLDELQAAILDAKLPYLDTWNKKRNEIADFYNKNLPAYKTQKIEKKGVSCYHLFIIESEERERLMDYLNDQGIGTLIHYPVPIHLQKCYNYLGYKEGDFPVAEKAAKHILSLPLYAELTENEQTHIVEMLNKFKENH